MNTTLRSPLLLFSHLMVLFQPLLFWMDEFPALWFYLLFTLQLVKYICFLNLYTNKCSFKKHHNTAASVSQKAPPELFLWSIKCSKVFDCEAAINLLFESFKTNRRQTLQTWHGVADRRGKQKNSAQIRHLKLLLLSVFLWEECTQRRKIAPPKMCVWITLTSQPFSYYHFRKIFFMIRNL